MIVLVRDPYCNHPTKRRRSRCSSSLAPSSTSMNYHHHHLQNDVGLRRRRKRPPDRSLVSSTALSFKTMSLFSTWMMILLFMDTFPSMALSKQQQQHPTTTNTKPQTSSTNPKKKKHATITNRTTNNSSSPTTRNSETETTVTKEEAIVNRFQKSSSSSVSRQRSHTRLSGYGSRRHQQLLHFANKDDLSSQSNNSNETTTFLCNHNNHNSPDFSQRLFVQETADGLVVTCVSSAPITERDQPTPSSSYNNKSILIRRPRHWNDHVQVEESSLPLLDNSTTSTTIVQNSSLSLPPKKTAPSAASFPDPVQVEALVGVYHLPSGNVWVWVAKSKVVYESPLSSSSSSSTSLSPEGVPESKDNNSARSLWQIRKVEQLHLVHLPTTTQDDIHDVSSPRLQQQQRHEELRQRALWRQALKDHDWYFCDRQTSVMPDMTRSFQAFFFRKWNQTSTRSGVAEEEEEQGSSSEEEKENSATITSAQSTTKESWNNTCCVPAQAPWYDPSSPAYPDLRFCWNAPVLLEALTRDKVADSQLLEWAVPLTSAFVGVQRNVSIHSSSGGRVASSYRTTKLLQDLTPSLTASTYDHILVSRRSRWRAGTRFTKRGADALGRVANYAETEQVVIRAQNRTATVQSHVQIRGSIPLRWSSPTDVKTYRPRVRIGTDPVAQARSLQLHMLEQMAHYVPTIESHDNNSVPKNSPSLVLVNLVDRHSDQGRLGRALDAVLDSVLDVYTESPDERVPAFTKKGVRHVWFDFHAELKGGRWDKLQILLNDLQPALEEHGYFQASQNDSGGAWQVEQWQRGVMRTNCMDCLDRTNVVQGIIARRMLVSQLSWALPLAYKSFYRKNPLSLPWSEGEQAHRSIWADNADAISRLYAGTPALKGDFTRTGKRTRKGALDDGMNSLQRYYLNNFLDADRQEGIDLLTCHEEFNHFDEGDDDDEGDETKALSPSGGRGVNLRDAARQLLLGATWQDMLNSPASVEDESDHVRIKVPDKKIPKRDRQKKRELGLMWLPGDLQTQMRELVSTQMLENSQDELMSSEPVLKAMDKRTSSEMPWWIRAASSSEEVDTDYADDDSHSASPVEKERFQDSTNSGPGFHLAALVASCQAPLATAAFLLSIAWASAFVSQQDHTHSTH